MSRKTRPIGAYSVGVAPESCLEGSHCLEKCMEKILYVWYYHHYSIHADCDVRPSWARSLNCC